MLALEDVSNPDNVGGVFRNARAFGADAIVLSEGCADPLYRKAIRTSMGAVLATPFAHLPDWEEGLARLRAARYAIVALTPEPSALDVACLAEGRPLPSRVALLLGAEGAGLKRRHPRGRRPAGADRDGARRGLAERRDGGGHRAPRPQGGCGARTRRARTLKFPSPPHIVTACLPFDPIAAPPSVSRLTASRSSTSPSKQRRRSKSSRRTVRARAAVPISS